MKEKEFEAQKLIATYEAAKEHHFHLIDQLSANSLILAETRKKICELLGEVEGKNKLGLNE